MSTPPPPVDVAGALADSLIAAVSAALIDCGVAEPGIMGQFAGSSLPLADPCSGIVWSRVVTQFPADATNRLLDALTWDARQPSFASTIELGHLDCHRTIEAEGSAIPPEEEASYATRNNAFRMVLMDAVHYRWKAAMSDMLRRTVERYTIAQPWAPIGPDGGYSGGSLFVTVSHRTIAIPGE